MRGLIVDDDELYLRTLQRALERRGHTVAVAADAAAAIEQARATQPDFAVVDLKLASENGLDLIAPLREAHPTLCIVLVTGYASVATAVEAIKRGADHYLAKPTTVAAILRAVQGESDEVADIETTMTPLSRLEWEHIQQAMIETDGNVSAAARLLGMHRRSLQRKLAKKPGSERRNPDTLD
jgi:two-component system, response regulator RegA